MLYTEGYEMEIEMLLYAFICLIFLIFSSFFYSKWKKSEITSFLFLMLWCLFSALQIVYIIGKYTDMLFFVKIDLVIMKIILGDTRKRIYTVNREVLENDRKLYKSRL